MSHFYRYLRPLEFNFNRYAVQIAPKGGVCFRVVDEGEDVGYRLVTLSAAICHDDDLFNQDVAKKIADQRFLYGTSYKLHSSTLATNVIALALVELSKNVHLGVSAGINATSWDTYRNLDLHHLADNITKIRNTHRVAWELDKMGREVVEALDLKNYYAKQQNR